MEENIKENLRQFLITMLDEHNDHDPFFDDESIFMSGRLDSFSMVNLVMHLEKTYGIDFSKVDFDVSLLDTVNYIVEFINSHRQK
jgi:acyl carrier protein